MSVLLVFPSSTNSKRVEVQHVQTDSEGFKARHSRRLLPAPGDGEVLQLLQLLHLLPLLPRCLLRLPLLPLPPPPVVLYVAGEGGALQQTAPNGNSLFR